MAYNNHLYTPKIKVNMKKVKKQKYIGGLSKKERIRLYNEIISRLHCSHRNVCTAAAQILFGNILRYNQALLLMPEFKLFDPNWTGDWWYHEDRNSRINALLFSIEMIKQDNSK